MLNAIDSARVNINLISIKIIIDIIVILANNYNKFFRKIYKRYISLNNLRKLIPSQYYNYIDI